MFRKTLKRSVSILTLLAMMLTLFPFAAFAEDTTASDLDGHWAEEVMQEWIGYGIIAGYEDGTVRPDRSITRAEMTALLDRVMDYQTTAANHFTDLDDNWYTDVVLKANAAGMISGYPDGTVRPNATISRQEAVAMFARVLSLDTANAPEADFTDMDAVGDWAKDAVNAMAAKGYVNGDNGQFRPQSGITRAEVITIFNNIFDDLYSESGTYFGDVNGSAVISADDVTLENTAIDGDLIVAEGVGDGHVVLDNVTIDGKLIIRGGGENSVIIRGNSSIGTVTVERIDGAVRVAVEDGASVDTLFVNDGSDTVTVEGTIGTLNVATGAAEVVLNGDTDTLNVSSENAVVTVAGTLGTVTVDETASDATINIQSDASVSTLTTAATNTTVNVLGSVETVQVADTASNATIAVSENASVSSVTTTAQNTTVSGTGTVTNVEVGETASGTTVTTPGTTVENNSSDDVTIGDGETIGAGDTATTPGGTTEEPSEPSTPSEPSGPSHTHNYVDGVCTAGDAYDPTWAQVNSAEIWNAAVAAGQNIVLTADFTTDAQLTINNTNSETGRITVNGDGHTITAAVPEGGSWSDVNGEKHLVLITDAADSSTTADNVTLKNITLDSANLAYGLQAYCVTDTALDNVTLTGSVGAGLTVNGSTVTATALHTSDNNWGGVNVDNGENVSGPTTFTFDATSTFNEDEGKAAVYSETEDVTIIAPAGWACIQVSGNYVWSKLFAGGNGTEESPYLITTAQEMKNVGLLADANNYFALQNNIDMTGVEASQADSYGDTGDIYQLYGTLNGNGHTITAKNSTAGTILYTQNATINDVTFAISGHPAVTNATSTTFYGVTVTGDMEVSNNNGAFVTYAVPKLDSSNALTRSVELTFNNCTADVTMLGGGASNNYNAVFVGYAYGNGKTSDEKTITTTTTLNFTNCVNEGRLICGKAALFLGNNSANNGIVNINVTNCTNNGFIRAAYADYTWDPFVATGTHTNNHVTLNNASVTDPDSEDVKSSLLGNGGEFDIAPDNPRVSLTLNNDQTFTIAPVEGSNLTDVAYYEVTMSYYADLLKADGSTESGTQIVSVSEKINATDTTTSTYTTTLKKLQFVDEKWCNTNTTATSSTVDGVSLPIYTLSGTSYYYIGSESETHATLKGTPATPTLISVSAYNADGEVLRSVGLTKSAN